MNSEIKIFIVEDEAITLMLLLKKLKDLGYKDCKSAATGEEAVKAVKIYDPSVILMDINLAGKMDGIEAAYQITDYKKIPIIFITGYSREEIENRVKDLNPLDIFHKPLDIDQIAKTIREKIIL